MNCVNLIGRLVADPDYKTGASNGKEYKRTTFTVAVNNIGKRTDFVRVVAFDKTAEVTKESFRKGNQIGITGSIKTGEYTDKEGRKIKTFDVLADRVYFLDPKNTNQRDGGFDESQAFAPFDDDMPF